MSFPLDPEIGDVFETINGRYEFTTKGVWKRLPPVGDVLTGLPTHVGSTPPVGPRLGDQWYNLDVDRLYTWATNGVEYYWQLFAGSNIVNTALSGSAAVDRLLPLTWAVGEQFAFEMWQTDTRYNWRDFGAVTVVGGTAGDDSLDVTSTEGIQNGQTYVVVNADGTKRFTIDVFAVVNSSRIRTRVNLPENLAANQNLTLARTSFAITGGYATVENADTYYSRWLQSLVGYVGGLVYLRRSAKGAGVFTVRARQFGAATWTVLKLARTLAVGADYRDEEYVVPFGGVVQYQVDYATSAGTETVYHMVTLPNKQGVDARRVDTPLNVSPADNAAAVSTTPTLQGSVFRSIYNLPQNGAEFQIATDETFRNLVLNTSSDFLASWVSAGSYAAPVLGIEYVEPDTFATVGGTSLVILNTNGVVQRTVSLGAAPRAVATDGTRILAVGLNGSIAVSTDKGVTVTSYTAGGAYAGELRGAAVRGQIALAVGATGEIQRSVNGGVIWAKIGTDNSYAGTFNSVTLTSTGYAIVVGANGEIQTSANNGATWTKRSANGGYTGTWLAVALDESGYAIAVGANGEIQTSDDFGATWAKRPAAGAYTGQFNAVDMRGTLAVAVGSGGEIQTSKDRGITWTHAVAAGSFVGAWFGAALTPDTTALLVGEGASTTTGSSQRTLNLRASTTNYTVPAGGFLEINKVYYWRVRYQDSAGFWSEYSRPTVFATAATLNGVKTPTNLAPAPDATDVSQQPTLQTSLFEVTGAADIHASTVYQISTSANMANPQEFNSSNAAERTTFTVPASANLQGDTKYYWRAKHRGAANGESAWSAATAFTVKLSSNTGGGARPLKILAIRETLPIPSDSAATKAEYFYGRFLVTNFYSAVPDDAYVQTQFQTSTDGASWPADSLGSFNALEEVAEAFDPTYPTYRRTGVQRIILKGATAYYRFRHIGTKSGSGPWSATLKFEAPMNSSFGEAVYTTPGTYTWTVPAGVTSVCAVVVGGGGGNAKFSGGSGWGGGGGGLTWKNNIPVTPGQQIQVVVGAGGQPGSAQSTGSTAAQYEAAWGKSLGGTSSFGSVISATGGRSYAVNAPREGFGRGGTTHGGDGGGNGGYGGGYPDSSSTGGGGGAGGYTGNGGHGAPNNDVAKPGTGGGGGGGTRYNTDYGGGGGVGLYGQGADGAAGTAAASTSLNAGKGGSGGANGSAGTNAANGGACGGGAGGTANGASASGGAGGVRIMWGTDRSFPLNAA